MRAILAIVALALLTACGVTQDDPLTAEQLQAVAFRADGPPEITVISVINNRTGQGGHAALMVSGSQRLIFDPAGSFRHSEFFRHDDVLYGITERKRLIYRSAHARTSHHVVSQSFTVSPEVAEQALQLIRARGKVASAFCANAVSSILQQLPGFSAVDVTFYPHRLRDQLAQFPGVRTDEYFENDAGDILDGMAALDPALSE